ncbi:cupin domain-containing protein [Methanothermobacter wolfeii]|uniref:Cupin domain-containing protein n=1 Tax=Methanothermobacter wolfeii TaxID=145261 RepID=A0A9E7UN44_METWO|nr:MULTISPECIES: cupin domain-containing protein [Methanothermobacter]NLM02001.1 cupin domain-containing protein [Methanothermobacter wolfeii]QHN07036.1 cupin domain-containing protein [Methanothermobacter sp. THM-1]UXH31641.1 cupin domain-containing protein [Methanothermobacter wolfeii]
MDGTLICEFLHPHREDLEMGFSVAHAALKPGESSLPHRLRKSVEVYYILEGGGEMHIGDESRKVKPGDIIYIPASSTQYIRNTGESDLSFLCMVSPPWRQEDEELQVQDQ